MDKKLFQTIEGYLLKEEQPSIKINQLLEDSNLENTPFEILREERNIQQEPKYHPEGNVWNHTLMVVDEAARLRDKSTDPRAFMWAALLHDIGKVKTTMKRNGRWTSYDHDTVGAEMVLRFLREYEEDKEFINKVSKLVKYHMHYLYVEKNLPYARPRKLLEETSLEDIVLLSFADRCGRGGLVSEDKIKIKASIEEFKNKLNSLWSLC